MSLLIPFSAVGRFSALGTLLPMLLIFVVACAGGKKLAGCSNNIKQGITGTITYSEGNFMPGPDAGKRNNSTQPVVRTIYIYPALTADDVEQSPERVIFIKVKAKKPSATVTSDSGGCFKVALAPGTYSIFSKEEDGLFSNFSDNGILNPVTVQSGQLTRNDINLNYNAAY